MRKLVIAASVCALFSASFMASAATAEKMDESTNPNSNVDTKTQNLQQKPNSDQPQATDKKTRHHDKTAHDHKSNVDPASDEMSRDGKSNTDKLRQAPN